MKLEVGMYVKYKNYRDIDTIAKIVEVRLPDEYVSECYYRFDTEDGTIESQILKASYNILDLIEVGDYVNDEKVIRIFNPMFMQMGELPYIVTTNSKYESQEIMDVVTKEQFSQMKYKIGE